MNSARSQKGPGACLASSLAIVTGGLSATAAAQVSFYSMGTWPLDIESVDLNRDGLTDLVTDHGSKIAVCINEGAGVFARPVGYPLGGGGAVSIAMADLDGDHDQDIVVGVRIVGGPARIVTMLNRGDGTFESPVVYIPFGSDDSFHVTTADLDNDGDQDVIFKKSSYPWVSTAHWYENDGHGALGSLNSIRLGMSLKYTQFLAGDFDDDGDIDVAFGGQTNDYYYSGASYIVFVFNDGQGQSWTAQPHAIPGSTHKSDDFGNFTSGDVDGDGDLDIAFTRNDYPSRHEIGLLINEGGRAFAFGDVFRYPHSYDVRLADMDGDGDLDIVSQFGTDALSLRVLINRNHASSFTNVVYPIGSQWHESPAIDICDFSDDGMLDAVVTRGRDTTGLWLITNTLAPDRPTLQQTALTRGETTTFTVSNAQPNAPVYFLYSFAPDGNSRGIAAFGSITLDLTEPIMLIGQQRADAGGVASIARDVPVNAPLTTVTTQAVVRTGPGGQSSTKTGFITAPILP